MLRRALAVQPGQPDLWGDLSTTLSRLGDYSGATEATASAASADPSRAVRVYTALVTGMFRRGAFR